MSRPILLLLFFCIHSVIVVPIRAQPANVQAKSEDTCQMPNGSAGSCVHIQKCANVKEMILKSIHPKICSFEGTHPIVCCDLDANVSTKNSSVSKFEKLCNEYYQSSERLDALILGDGVNPQPKDFPYMAALGFDDEGDPKFLCGGTLITDTYVLTSAHCLVTREYGHVKYVRIGSDLNEKKISDTSKTQDFTIKRVIAHPDYKRPSVYHDIALIELNRPAIKSEFIMPACLQTRREIDVKKLIATAWDSNGQLQKVHVNLVSIEDCKKRYQITRKLSTGIMDDWQICAGGDRDDRCQGDSGGPLQYANSFSGGYTVVGLSSFGTTCAIHVKPDVYTRVSNYIEWIESVVFANA